MPRLQIVAEILARQTDEHVVAFFELLVQRPVAEIRDPLPANQVHRQLRGEKTHAVQHTDAKNIAPADPPPAAALLVALPGYGLRSSGAFLYSDGTRRDVRA